MSLFAPRSYSDKLEDAAGEGADGETARAYAGGARPLGDFLGDGGDEDEHPFINLDDADAPKRRAEELRADSDRDKEHDE